MAKPNYAYEKRQRELEKKQKKENKAQRKAAGAPAGAQDGDVPSEPEVPAGAGADKSAD
jgi:hypothetical protein